MDVDLSSRKIQVFPGINDTPAEPSASKAGNGSHLISQYNSLVDDLQISFNSLVPPQNTDDLIEGTSNLYYTDARVDDRINALNIPVLEPADINSGLLSFWKFNELENAFYDSSGANNLSINGTGITVDAGVVKNAVQFDNNSYLNTAGMTPRLHLLSNKGYTASIWVKTSSANINQVIFNHGGYNYLYITPFNRFAWAILNNESEISVDHPDIITPGNWYHVVCTYNPSTKRKSIIINDGAVYTSTRSLGNLTYTGAAPFNIGAEYGGAIDAFGLWERELSPEEITFLYNDGNGRELVAINSANRFHFRTPPSASTSLGSQGEIRLDGDYLYICTAPNTWKRCLLSSW